MCFVWLLGLDRAASRGLFHREATEEVEGGIIVLG